MTFNRLEIGELVTLRQGFAINKKTNYHISEKRTNLPLLRIGDMKDGAFKVFVRDTIPDKFIAKKSDVIYTRTGQVGAVFRGQLGVIHNNCFTVNTKDETVLLQEFIFYMLQEKAFYEEAISRATGAAQPDLPHGAFNSIQVFLPPIDSQRNIIKILSNYDNLIENNQKQIKLLEEATQRLYKEWFVDLRFPGHENVEIVDGIPEGWSKVSMDQIAEYINGYAFKPSDWSEFGKPIIKIKELNEGITKSTPRNDGSFIPDKYNISVGDIIFSWSATLTAKIWDAEEGLLNQHLFKVIPKKGISREYVLQSILNTLEWFRNLTTGSTMKHIQRGKLKEVFVCLPSNNIMNLYVKIAELYRERLLKLNQQNIYLTEARNRLLPKLMSGGIEV